MKKRNNLPIAGASTLILTVGLIAPALGQERGGVTTTFTLNQDIRSTRNADLDPGGDDVRTVLNTDISATLASNTRRSSIALTVGGRLRYSFGDVDADDEGFDVGRERVQLSYTGRAPRARFSARFNYLREDVSFLETAELLLDDDGAIIIIDDLADLEGTGTRESFRYRLSAQFDEDGPFGWGATLSGTELDFSDVSSAALEDRSTLTAALNAHLDITPTFRLDSRLAYSERDTDSTDKSSTTSVALTGTAVRSDQLTVRGTVSYESPENTDDRIEIGGGFSYAITPRSELSVDLGAVFSDGFDTRLTGRINYQAEPTRRSRFNLQLRSSVSDAADDDVVVNTVALGGYDYQLTSQSSVSFDFVYAQEDDLTTGVETTNLSTSLQLNRRLTEDWRLSVGVSSRNRRVSNADNANSEEVFVSIGRDWTGRF